MQEAAQLREEIGENWEIGYTYNFLGEAYSKSNRKQIAEITFHKAIGSSQLNENLKQRYESYEALSKHFERFGQYDSALFYHQKFAFLQDSLMREHEKASTAGIIANYEFEKTKHNRESTQEERKPTISIGLPATIYSGNDFRHLTIGGLVGASV